jgi:hypothetical protein
MAARKHTDVSYFHQLVTMPVLGPNVPINSSLGLLPYQSHLVQVQGGANSHPEVNGQGMIMFYLLSRHQS